MSAKIVFKARSMNTESYTENMLSSGRKFCSCAYCTTSYFAPIRVGYNLWYGFYGDFLKTTHIETKTDNLNLKQ